MAAGNITEKEQNKVGTIHKSSLLVPSWLTSQSCTWEQDHGPLWTYLRLLHPSPRLAELGLAPTRCSKASFHRDFVKDVGTRCQGFVHHLCTHRFENTRVRYSAFLQQQPFGNTAEHVPWPGCCARWRRAAWPGPAAAGAAGPVGWGAAAAAAAARGAAARCPCATAPGWSGCSARPPCWRWPSSPRHYSGTEWARPQDRSGKQPKAKGHTGITSQEWKHLNR